MSTLELGTKAGNIIEIHALVEGDHTTDLWLTPLPELMDIFPSLEVEADRVTQQYATHLRPWADVLETASRNLNARMIQIQIPMITFIDSLNRICQGNGSIQDLHMDNEYFERLVEMYFSNRSIDPNMSERIQAIIEILNRLQPGRESYLTGLQVARIFYHIRYDEGLISIETVSTDQSRWEAYAEAVATHRINREVQDQMLAFRIDELEGISLPPPLSKSIEKAGLEAKSTINDLMTIYHTRDLGIKPEKLWNMIFNTLLPVVTNTHDIHEARVALSERIQAIRLDIISNHRVLPNPDEYETQKVEQLSRGTGKEIERLSISGINDRDLLSAFSVFDIVNLFYENQKESKDSGVITELGNRSINIRFGIATLCTECEITMNETMDTTLRAAIWETYRVNLQTLLDIFKICLRYIAKYQDVEAIIMERILSVDIGLLRLSCMGRMVPFTTKDLLEINELIEVALIQRIPLKVVNISCPGYPQVVVKSFEGNRLIVASELNDITYGIHAGTWKVLTNLPSLLGIFSRHAIPLDISLMIADFEATEERLSQIQSERAVFIEQTHKLMVRVISWIIEQYPLAIVEQVENGYRLIIILESCENIITVFQGSGVIPFYESDHEFQEEAELSRFSTMLQTDTTRRALFYKLCQDRTPFYRLIYPDLFKDIASSSDQERQLVEELMISQGLKEYYRSSYYLKKHFKSFLVLQGDSSIMWHVFCQVSGLFPLDHRIEYTGAVY